MALCIMMWKHYLVRKRRFIVTFFEFTSPCFLFVLVHYLKGFIAPELSKIKLSETEGPFNVTFSPSSDAYPTLVLYTPNTPLTDRLMDEVNRRLGLHRIKGFPDQYSKGYYGVSVDQSTLFAVTELVNKMGINGAIVNFQDMYGTQWPSKLNYTIRTKINYMTNEYRSLDKHVQPNHAFGSIYHPFLRLQWAIDSSFIQLTSNRHIPSAISLAEFPFNAKQSQAMIRFVMAIGLSVYVMSLFLPFVFLMSRLVEDRASGVQELVKMAGVSNSTLKWSHVLNMIPSGLVYCISGVLFLKLPPHVLLPQTDEEFIFLALALHFGTVLALAFMFSNVTKNAQYGVPLATLSYVALTIPVEFLRLQYTDGALKILIGLVPHLPLSWFIGEVSTLELINDPISFSNWMESHTPLTADVFTGYILSVVQIIVYCLINDYLSQVMPGHYGVARPWYYVCQFRKKDKSKTLIEQPVEKDPKYFEPVPATAKPGIQIKNVSKVYGKKVILSNVTFDVLKGEIMILLGHNGAGKSTLMSIITGMISMTKGQVLVNSLDISKHKKKVRPQMGLCPQHNLFFSHLTVLEHTMFFALLRKQKISEARSSSMALLEVLGIADKANSHSNELSGGMKRRLQLACALAGNAEVLILDEPTSGLDVQTRRELWDLILSLRGSRTVLLTTHFMEEADALGDRVAALHGGVLRCHATPMYLKESIGTGTRLKLTTIGPPNEEDITALVKSVVPAATLREHSKNTLVYNLPSSASNKFPKLFSKLEGHRQELKVDSIGVSASALEDVFLKLCSDFDASFVADEAQTQTSDLPEKTLQGVPLACHQFWCLVRRQLRYIWFTKVFFFLLNCIVPLLIILVFTLMMSIEDSKSKKLTNKELAMNFDMYNDMPEKKVLYKVEKHEPLRRVKERYGHRVKFHPAREDVGQAILRAGDDSEIEYMKYLAGVQLDDTTPKVLFTTTVRHAAPVALNLFSNMLAAEHIPGADGKTIATHNHPLEGRHFAMQQQQVLDPVSAGSGALWVLVVMFAFTGALTGMLALPVTDRVNSTRHIHIMMGCSPTVHWIATFLTAIVIVVLMLVLPVLLIVVLVDTKETFNNLEFCESLFDTLLLTGMAFLALGYLFTFYLGERTVGLAVTLIGAIGSILGSIKTVADFSRSELKRFIKPPCYLSMVFIPTHEGTAALLRSVHMARVNAYCRLNHKQCPALVERPDLAGFDLKKCCELNEDPLKYGDGSIFSPLKDHIILLVQAIVYMILVILTQKGIFNSLFDKIVNFGYTPPFRPWHHDKKQVIEERQNVSEKIEDDFANPRCDTLLVYDVYKNYMVWFKYFTPVKGISFRVKRGECFGLLGVNGAGKSTTFKMITGEECATLGQIWANDFFLHRNRQQYLRCLGYCPQFFGLDEFQTGRQNLALLLTLRGYRAKDVEREVAAWLDVVGLENHSDKIVSGYSGGCQRRLAAAGGLAGGSDVALLDEPTTGVDVAARRRVWSAMRRGLKKGRSIVITSHSMDEMEALCDRIAIMRDGEIVAIGSPAQLRAQYAMGHAVVFKLKPQKRDPRAFDRLINKMHRRFDCYLRDYHETMMHFYIRNRMRYSQLFTMLEELKTDLDYLIDGYSVTETTLEEVFLSFTKPRHN